MENNKKLELTLCGMLPYGLKAENCFKEIAEVKGIEKGTQLQWMFEKNTNILIAYDYECKPVLHSLRKLTENILDDENDYFYGLNYDLCDILGVSDCENFVNAIIENKKYVVAINTSIEAIEWLKKNHFNLYGLPKDMYIEKSTLNL